MGDLIVVKFGGTSVKDPERLRIAARKVQEEVCRGNRVVVVVSAKAGVTNDLIRQFAEVAGDHPKNDPFMAERDAVLAAGEQINAALMAAQLRVLGLESRSFQAWQADIFATGPHGAAQIEGVYGGSGVKHYLDKYLSGVPVVTGFQALTKERRIATFERGGSDLTAVVLAILLRAKRCDIYTDVDAVRTADPRITPEACSYERISYHDMLGMAQEGAKVLDRACVERAKNAGLIVQVLSSASHVPVGSDLPGTILSSELSRLKDGRPAVSVSQKTGYTKIQIKWAANDSRLKFAGAALQGLSSEIITFSGTEGGSVIEFSVKSEDAGNVQEQIRKAMSGQNVEMTVTENLAKVSVTGEMLKTLSQARMDVLAALKGEDIDVSLFSASDTVISVLVSEDKVADTVDTLHRRFRFEDPVQKTGPELRGNS